MASCALAVGAAVFREACCIHLGGSRDRVCPELAMMGAMATAAHLPRPCSTLYQISGLSRSYEVVCVQIIVVPKKLC